MRDYVNSTALQEYTTKLVAKLKTLFPGTPTAAATVADMTDHSKTYVYVGSETGYTAGDWYYWDGTAWTSGGPFQATSIITDTTLAVAGEAADAKATGDAIAAAKTAVLNAMAPAYSTSATYAVGDYVNYNGSIYRCTTAITTAESWTSGHWTAVTLGADLEGQVSDLKTQLNALDCSGLWENGYYTTNGEYIGKFTSNDNYRSCILHVENGDRIKLTGIGASSGRLWAFADKDGQIKRVADSGAYLVDGILTVNTDEAYFVFNASNTSNLYPPALSLMIDRAIVLENLRTEINTNNEEIKSFDCSNLFENGYYNTSGEYIGSFVTGNYRTCILTILPGDRIKITGAGATAARLWAFADYTGKITRRADINTNETNKTLTAENGEKYFIFNGGYPSNNYPPAVFLTIDRAVTLEQIITDIDVIKNVRHIKNDLTTDGHYNLPEVKCYNNGNESKAYYGQDNTKYVMDLGDYEKCHVFFKYRHNTYDGYSGTDVMLPICAVGANDALNIGTLYREITSQGGALYKKAYFYAANITTASTELMNPQFYKPANGEDALLITYSGSITSATSISLLFDNGAASLVVDGETIGTATITSTDTIQEFADALSLINGVNCEILNSNGTVGDLLLPDSLSIDMKDSAIRDGTTYYDALMVGIPFKIDRSWHTCEIIIDKIGQNGYVAFDGYTKYVSFSENRALSDNYLIVGGNNNEYGNITVKDLEIDINSLGDAEILYGKINDASTNNSYQLASNHNPRLMIFEGHGILVGSESEALTAYQQSGSDTSQEAMQASTDRLNIVFTTLKNRGYIPVSLADVKDWKEGKKELPKRCFVPIFDDNRLINYVDYDKRKPFIKNGVTPGLAQITGNMTPTGEIIANGTTYTTSDAVTMITLANWYICSHTAAHRQLTQYTQAENIDLLKNDVLSCDINGLHSDILVYPYGEINGKTIQAIKKSDFMLGISIVEQRYNCKALNNYRLVRTELGTRATLENVLSPFI